MESNSLNFSLSGVQSNIYNIFICILLHLHIFVSFVRNAIQFTPTQVEAIKAGMQPGLTMVIILYICAIPRDANQYDFIVFSTIYHAKYDTTIFVNEIQFSEGEFVFVCIPLLSFPWISFEMDSRLFA